MENYTEKMTVFTEVFMEHACRNYGPFQKA